MAVISFAAAIAARAWQADTGVPFPLLLDPARTAYRAYGLERSWLRSWGLRNVWYTVRAVGAGRSWQGIQGDSAQLGGDFVVDAGGVLRFAYRSHDPTDRPPVRQLLAVLRAFHVPPR